MLLPVYYAHARCSLSHYPPAGYGWAAAFVFTGPLFGASRFDRAKRLHLW